MIYSFKKVDHPIQLFHENISQVFKNIFDNNLKVYDEDVLIPKDFIPIVNSSETRLETPLKEIVKVYYSLPNFAKIQLKEAFKVNNDINVWLFRKDRATDFGSNSATLKDHAII
ncbi:hypothetical protein V5739_14660 [Salinimicrobium sp. TIG7-5_MAKvit]|uniref:hypothetical protein n=1 Tax=Salinimicrobium sp. TIG7-5_MAKvit TaxID=3121289 RepID=UPI003C6DCF38